MSTNAAPPSLGRAEVPIGPRPLPAPPTSQYGRFSALADTDFDAAVNAAVGIDGNAGAVRWSEVMDNEEGNARAAAPAPVSDAATSSSAVAGGGGGEIDWPGLR
ncbi:hypothetical protein OC834_006999 [Tilletia horrida]|nr:hypothetical protein OC834_006999 [Tilletia horrida]